MDEKETFSSSAVTDAELDASRGRFGLVFNTNTLSANLTDNTADGAVSGANSINDGAFSNINGLTSVVQNSGNNVIIQSSFIVNVNFQEGPPVGP